MFPEGTVLKNKHNNHIVRLLTATAQDGTVMICNVTNYGYHGVGGCSEEHWEQISILRWWLAFIPWIVKEFVWRITYNQDKELGYINRELFPIPRFEQSILNWILFRMRQMF